MHVNLIFKMHAKIQKFCEFSVSGLLCKEIQRGRLTPEILWKSGRVGDARISPAAAAGLGDRAENRDMNLLLCRANVSDDLAGTEIIDRSELSFIA